MKYFNTAGPCFPEEHYMVPPEPRLPEVRELVERGRCFVLHAPRQTGKTTVLISLARELTAEGRFAALYFSCERAEAAGDDFGQAEQLVLAAIREWADDLPPELRPPDPWPPAPAGGRLSSGLTAWGEADAHGPLPGRMSLAGVGVSVRSSVLVRCGGVGRGRVR